MANSVLDTFMAAIRRLESGSFEGNYSIPGPPIENPDSPYYGTSVYGAYQIMEIDWAWRANTAGLAGADIRDPAMQDAVARWWFTKYYERYQDWGLVAVAWFGGEGAANIAERDGMSAVADRADQTGTSVPKYVDDLMQYFAEAAQDPRYAPTPAPTLSSTASPHDYASRRAASGEPVPEGYSGVDSGQASINPALSNTQLNNLLAQWGTAGIMPTTYRATVSSPDDNLAALMLALNPDAGSTMGRVVANTFAQGLSAMSRATQNRSGIDMSSVDYSQLKIKQPWVAPDEENE